jgi:hypothetical protein
LLFFLNLLFNIVLARSLFLSKAAAKNTNYGLRKGLGKYVRLASHEPAFLFRDKKALPVWERLLS